MKVIFFSIKSQEEVMILNNCKKALEEENKRKDTIIQDVKNKNFY